MAKQELRRKIIATVLTVTMLCALLGVCAWLLLSNNTFNSTIHTTMLLCTAVLGIATIGLLVAKVQEILALREVVRKEEAEKAQTPPPVQHSELEPLQSLDHKTIELPALTDIPLATEQPAAPKQQKTKLGRRGRDTSKQPEPESVHQAVEVVPPTPVSYPEPAAETPKWKPIDFGAALKARENQAVMARRRVEEEARRAQEEKLAAQRRAEEEALRAQEEKLAAQRRAEEEAQCAQEEKPAEQAPCTQSESTDSAFGKDDAVETMSASAPAAAKAEEAADLTVSESDTAQANESVCAQEISFSEPEIAESADAAQTLPAEPDADAFDYDSANAEHLQAIRHVQEARRSAEAKAEEDAQLAAVARKAEEERLAAQPQPCETQAPDSAPSAAAAQDVQPIDSGMWEAWQPNAIHFDEHPAESAPAAESEPAVNESSEQWTQTLSGTVQPRTESYSEPKNDSKKTSVPKKKKHVFFGIFNRRKADSSFESDDRNEAKASAPLVQEFTTAPAPSAEPAVEDEPAPAPVKLNVKPIAWPAPPPPSRNFVHPPQSTMQFAAITPEQIAQIQAEAHRQKAQQVAAQRQAATEQAARNAEARRNASQANPARQPKNPQSENTVQNTESYWKN